MKKLREIYHVKATSDVKNYVHIVGTDQFGKPMEETLELEPINDVPLIGWITKHFTKIKKAKSIEIVGRPNSKEGVIVRITEEESNIKKILKTLFFLALLIAGLLFSVELGKLGGNP